MSKASKKIWSDPNHYLNSEEYKQRVSDIKSKFQQNRPQLNRYNRGKGSRRIIGGKETWFRSTWEVIYARYLQFLLDRKDILKWEYEKETFWFEKIKRGVRSYRPDFKVTNNDESIEYHEVKGWMDAKSRTKLKRMKKYYPKIKIIIIDNPVIKQIKRMGFSAR